MIKENDILISADGQACIYKGSMPTGFKPEFCFRLSEDTDTSFNFPDVYVGYKGLFAGIVQLALKVRGFYKDGIDCDFGAKSHKALYDFIKAQGLETETVCNDEIYKLLLKEV